MDMEEMNRLTVEGIKDKLTGDILDDISMIGHIADSIPPENHSVRAKAFTMMQQAGKYAFITENHRTPPWQYKEYVLRNIDADLNCNKWDLHKCFNRIQASSNGDADALIELGKGFYGGSLKEIDWPFAAFCFELAAERGNKSAQFMIANLYINGHGVSKNMTKAADWYKKIAEQGDLEAQFQLGLMYDSCDGIEEDKKEAAYWYEKSARQGKAEAQHNLALLYFLEKDMDNAVLWLEKATGQGHNRAQRLLMIIRGAEFDDPHSLYYMDVLNNYDDEI